MRGSWSTNWLSPSYWNPALFYICIYIVMLLHTISVKDWGTVRTAFFNYVIIAAPADVVLRIVNIMVIKLFFFYFLTIYLNFFLARKYPGRKNTKIYCEIGSAVFEILYFKFIPLLGALQLTIFVRNKESWIWNLKIQSRAIKYI